MHGHEGPHTQRPGPMERADERIDGSATGALPFHVIAGIGADRGQIVHCGYDRFIVPGGVAHRRRQLLGVVDMDDVAVGATSVQLMIGQAVQSQQGAGGREVERFPHFALRCLGSVSIEGPYVRLNPSRPQPFHEQLAAEGTPADIMRWVIWCDDQHLERTPGAVQMSTLARVIRMPLGNPFPPPTAGRP